MGVSRSFNPSIVFFQMRVRGKKYLFIADDESKSRKWVEVLRDCIAWWIFLPSVQTVQSRWHLFKQSLIFETWYNIDINFARAMWAFPRFFSRVHSREFPNVSQINVFVFCPLFLSECSFKCLEKRFPEFFLQISKFLQAVKMARKSLISSIVYYHVASNIFNIGSNREIFGEKSIVFTIWWKMDSLKPADSIDLYITKNHKTIASDCKVLNSKNSWSYN